MRFTFLILVALLSNFATANEEVATENKTALMSCFDAKLKKAYAYAVWYGRGTAIYIAQLPSKIEKDIQQRYSPIPLDNSSPVNYTEAFIEAQARYQEVATRINQMGCRPLSFSYEMNLSEEDLKVIKAHSQPLN